MLLADEETQDTTSFEYLHSRLAVESIANGDVLGIFRRVIPKARNLISGFFESLASLEISTEISATESKDIDKVYAKILKELSKFNYLAYKDVLVSVPEGFQGKLHPYLRFMLTTGKVNLELGLQAVRSYNTELSVFLSSSDIRTSLTAHNELYTKIRHERMAQQKAMAVFFKNGSTLSRRPLGSLIDRFGDLEDCFRDATALESIRKSQNYHTLLSEVKRSVELLDLVRKRSEEGSIDKISGPMAKHLADGAYETASYVENTVVYGYHLETITSTVRNLATQLQESFRLKG